MKDKEFVQIIQAINENLINKPVERSFNSIGSHIFIEFGKLKEVEFPNGKKSSQREWSIWLGHVSWRITKNNRHYIGSGENLDVNIQHHLQKLLGKCFQSFRFLSQFLDVEFNFEEGYQITTFFNWKEDNQWTIFLPDDSNIGVDCSSAEAIKTVQNLSRHFAIEESYRKIDLPLPKTVITQISFNASKLPVFHFENGSSIHLEACAWRLEKNTAYVIGCLDEDFNEIKSELTRLIGKSLSQIGIANAMMDARFQFEDGLILKTFSCCHAEEQWKVYEEKKVVFCASIALK